MIMRGILAVVLIKAAKYVRTLGVPSPHFQDGA
jgi:hypothetical protein